MFWIPVAMICAIVWLLKVLAEKSENSGAEKRDKMQEQFDRMKFKNEHTPDIDLIYDIKDWMMTHNHEDYVDLVKEFMNDRDDNWKYFARKSEYLELILLAQRGKTKMLYVKPPFIVYKPGDPRPYVLWEMAERFFLRLEEVLREKGVNVTAVGRYAGFYRPVREWVERYGYAKYMNDDTIFSWKEITSPESMGRIDVP